MGDGGLLRCQDVSASSSASAAKAVNSVCASASTVRPAFLSKRMASQAASLDTAVADLCLVLFNANEFISID